MPTKYIHDKKLLREIVVVLIVKLLLIFFIWHSFFDDTASPITANTIADKFINDDTKGDPL